MCASCSLLAGVGWTGGRCCSLWGGSKGRMTLFSLSKVVYPDWLWMSGSWCGCSFPLNTIAQRNLPGECWSWPMLCCGPFVRAGPTCGFLITPLPAGIQNHCPVMSDSPWLCLLLPLCDITRSLLVCGQPFKWIFSSALVTLVLGRLFQDEMPIAVIRVQGFLSLS